MWQGVSAPSAVYYSGYTYLGWVNAGGDVMVMAISDALVASTPVTLHAALGGTTGNPDLHDSPSMIVEATTHKLIVAYSAHNGSHPLVRVSTSSLLSDPTLAGGFDTEVSIGASAQYTYASLVQNASGVIMLFIRSISSSTGSLVWFYSTDNGVTWLTPLHATIATVASTLIYWRIFGGGTSRIDIAITDTDRSDASPSSLYHCYLGFTGSVTDGIYKTDGTLIAAYGSGWPINPTSGTLVKNTASGPASPEDVLFTGGVPNIALMTYAASDVQKWVARWTGAAWQVDDVALTGGLNNGNRFQLGSAFRNGSPDGLYMPVKVGSYFELYKQISPDSGTTWNPTALTTGSSSNNFDPQPVASNGTAVYVIYAAGTYTSDHSYSAAIRGTAT